MDTTDVAIIGAGFGGLACGLELARRGLDVAVFERLTYPGGCASTFERKGYRFESGATLFSGFGEGLLFGRWIEDFDLDVEFEGLDPLVTMRTGDLEFEVSPSRDRFIERFCSVDGAPKEALRSFFDWQHKVADALWECFEDPELLPPFSIGSLGRHVMRSPRYLRLASVMGRSFADVLRRHDVWEFEPMRQYADAVCQITVQASAERAEAPFALAAMDYFFRGTGHIHGGIGHLAHAIADQIEDFGGSMRFADPVTAIEREAGGWRVDSRRSDLRARSVVANLLPSGVADILGRDVDDIDALRELQRGVESGWGAAMLYLGVDASKIDGDSAHHLQLVGDPDAEFQEGNHIFCSISAADETERAPDGQRTVTVSTHVDMQRLYAGASDERAAYIDAVHQRMRDTLKRRAPEVSNAVVFEMTASPRTFERFTGRRRGYVGGIPRTTGLHNYRNLSPQEVVDDLYIVGDTVFPGQSTLAVALGGVRVAEAIA